MCCRALHTKSKDPCQAHNMTLTLKALYFFMKTLETKGFISIYIIITVLVSSFRFIWIPMLWVYDHYKSFHSYSAWIDFRLQNLTSTDVRFWRLKSIPALWGLKSMCLMMIDIKCWNVLIYIKETLPHTYCPYLTNFNNTEVVWVRIDNKSSPSFYVSIIFKMF